MSPAPRRSARLPAGVPQRLELLLLPGAGLVLAFAALTFGATPAWARAGMELAVLGLLGVWWLAAVWRGQFSFRVPALFYPMLAIFLFVALQAFAPLSVYPPATREQVWELLAVGGFFFLLYHQLARPGRLERFLTGLLVFAFALAVFAILQGLRFEGKIYWFWQAPEGSSPFGPFINRNHYAAWALMLLPLAWVKFAQWRRRLEPQVFWGLAVLALGVSVLLSLSRAGLILFVLAFPLYWLLSRSGRRSRRWSLAVGLAVVVAAVGLTLALDTGTLLSRWQTLGELFSRPQAVDEHRWQIWQDTLGMIRDHLWVGSGLETYGEISDAYRSFYSRLEWHQAHNDYLQWLAETGLVGAALALWFLVTLARTAAEQLRLSPHGPQRRYVVAALTGCGLVLLHSLVDFPLRIPANALLFVALLAVITAPLAAATTLHEGRPHRKQEPAAQTESRLV
ncbi:MAG: O-antigen ligase family protein [Candidatus Acidoferrales bacterium]